MKRILMSILHLCHILSAGAALFTGSALYGIDRNNSALSS